MEHIFPVHIPVNSHLVAHHHIHQSSDSHRHDCHTLNFAIPNPTEAFEKRETDLITSICLSFQHPPQLDTHTCPMVSPVPRFSGEETLPRLAADCEVYCKSVLLHSYSNDRQRIRRECQNLLLLCK